MSHFSKRWLWLAGLLVLVLALGAACGDDDDDDDDGGEATSPAATATEGGSPTATEADSGELLTDVGVSDTEIKLGLTIVQSGNLAAIYQPVFPALNAYFDYVNEEKGGICGREINLIVEDDQYSPAAGLEQAKKLVEQDGILAFVGNLGTPPVTGQVDYINEQEVPHLWVSTGAAKFGSGQYPWTLGYIPDYISDGGVQGAYIAENFPGATVATLSQNDDFGKDGITGFKAGFGGAIAAEQTYESTATDINSQLAVLRDANPDVLFLQSTPAFTARTFAYMAANDWHPQVSQSYVNAPTQLASLVGGGTTPEQLAAGFAILAGTLSTNYILDYIADADDPAIVEHGRIMGAYGGGSVTSLSVYAQGLAETMEETLNIACDNGDMTRAGTLAAAESLSDFHPTVLLEGININTSAEDHYAIQSLLPVEIQADGTLLALADEPIAAD